MLNYSLREESERVSELKSMSGSSKLPFGTLALGAEGIKEAIKGFNDACVLFICFSQCW
jgi:serine/threonine-protein phosphatase 2B catalytic subunit